MKRNVLKVFNRGKLLQNKTASLEQPDLERNNYLNAFYQTSVENTCYNIGSIRKNFHNVAIISSVPHLFLNQLPTNIQPENIFLCDTSQKSLENSLALISNNCDFQSKYPKCNLFPLTIEEELWCFKPESLDLIISNHHLHWVNDLHIAFLRFLDSLRPDGAFIGSVFGSDTLEELRIALTLAETERNGGVSQHTNPFISIIELGNLLARCSFNLPTVFSEKKQLVFDSPIHLMQFLQSIGENNALLGVRAPFSLLETMLSALAIYENCFQFNNIEEKNNEKMVSCTFEEIYFLGWKYHESQQKPKKRGSAEFSLKQLQEEMSEIQGVNEKGEVEYGEIHEEDASLNKKNEKLK